MQWQAKAKTRRHGQNQLCKFCGQTVGIWAHYATCSKRPNSLVDIEIRIYFESDRTTTLADILRDPGLTQLIDRNYYGTTIPDRPPARIPLQQNRNVDQIFSTAPDLHPKDPILTAPYLHPKKNQMDLKGSRKQEDGLSPDLVIKN